MNRPKHRTVLLLMYFLFLLWSLYYYIPGVVFYYDQLKGKGMITQISQKRVHLDYYHEYIGNKVSVSFREGNKLYLDRLLYVDKVVDLKYSKHFPSLISIIDYHSSPGLGGIIMILFFIVPLLVFNRIKF